MPDPTQRQTPKGQAHGEASEQQEFIAQTAVDVAPVQPLTLDPTIIEPDIIEDDEPDGQLAVEVDDGVEVDLMEVLLGASQRPDEAVTAGIPGAPIAAQTRMADVLDGLQRKGFDTPDVRALAQIARALNL